MESRKKDPSSRSWLCGVLVLCVHLQLVLTGDTDKEEQAVVTTGAWLTWETKGTFPKWKVNLINCSGGKVISFCPLRDCPADGRTWVPFGDRCYHFVHGEEDRIKSYTFERAKTLCQGFELLSIQSAAENNFVLEYCPRVWKGNVNVWLGMYYDTNSEDMRWFGEAPVTFTNWEDSSFPSDLVPVDTCVALHSNSGRWENVSCMEDVENGVICETAQEAEAARPKPNALLSALVILSVVAIVGISAVIWFVHQKHNIGTTILTAFEYHPPFRVLETDQSCLVEAEETDNVP